MQQHENDIDIYNDGEYKKHTKLESNTPSYRSYPANHIKNSGNCGKGPRSLSRCYSEGDVLLVLNASYLLNSVENNSIDVLNGGTLCNKTTRNKCFGDITKEHVPYNKCKRR